MNNLSRMSGELLSIADDLPSRCNDRKSIDDFELYSFEQVWPSTALGFGGMGGQMITAAQTYVFVPKTSDEKCHVYFGGRHAYSADCSDAFFEDVRHHNMASRAMSGKYPRT